MAVVYATYSLTGEAIKESVVRKSTELAVDGESVTMPNEFHNNSAMSDVYIVLFISQPHF